MSLDNIRIVLVRTFHPGNIGSAARSMKTMGLSDLCLVNPHDFPSEEAMKMAAGATDVVDKVKVVDSLAEAIADCTVVVASTARPRGYDLPCLNPEECAIKLHAAAHSSKVALIFGPERMGLHNEDIRLAKYRVTIPANPDYSSLNMAAAVQTLSYEILKASNNSATKHSDGQPQHALPKSADVERLYDHLEQVLAEIGFLRAHQGETMQRIRHFFARAEISQSELNIVRGILRAMQRSLNGPD